MEVRREALLPLARGRHEGVPQRVRTLLADHTAIGMHDLCCRIVADLGLADLLPAIRPLLSSPDEVIRIAALEAVTRMKDSASRDAAALAARDANERIAAAGRRAVAVLDGALP